LKIASKLVMYFLVRRSLPFGKYIGLFSIVINPNSAELRASIGASGYLGSVLLNY